MESLIEYLFNSGVLENGTEEDIAEAKKAYRKKYLRAKKEEYKQTRIRKEILLLPKEYSLLCKAAQKMGLKIAPYIKQAALSYTKKEFLLPSDSKVHDLEIAIRRIGNNINQVSFYVNYHKTVSQNEINALQYHLNQLEEEISKHFREPKDLLEIIKLKIDENSSFLREIQCVISQHLNHYDH